MPVARGVDLLQAWGLEGPGRPNHVRRSMINSATCPRVIMTGPPKLTAAWSDPAVAAVWTGRGGYGAQRMIDLIDFDALRAAGPKHFLRLLRATALHERIGRELNQVTLHSPAVATALAQLADRPTADQLRRLIFEPPRPGLEIVTGATTLSPGTAEGC